MQYTWSEFVAASLLLRAGRLSLTTAPLDYHKAGNEIIGLAEAIKAERAVIAMQPVVVAAPKAG